jgi:DNA gyrase subunit B
MSKKTYTAADIDTLEILDAIRARVGMYLGSADDDGVAVAVREVIDNAIDEHMNGHGSTITISVDAASHLISVEDEARGIPVEEHSKHPGLSTLEVVLTKAHSGGKFGTSYGISGGLHGTGLKAVTATSTYLKATVWRDGQEHTIEFRSAKRIRDIESAVLERNKKRTGTKIEFILDPIVFKDASSMIPGREALQRMLRERAYLNPGLTLRLKWKDETGTKDEVFREERGLDAFIESLAGDKVLFKKVAHFENPEDSEIRVAIAVAWTSGYGRDSIQGFCNCVRQPEGGTHVQGVRMALPQIVRGYIENNNLVSVKERDLKIEAPDCFEGVMVLVAIRHRSPVFKGQSKGR